LSWFAGTSIIEFIVYCIQHIERSILALSEAIQMEARQGRTGQDRARQGKERKKGKKKKSTMGTSDCRVMIGHAR
jgi:hypothetical protein